VAGLVEYAVEAWFYPSLKTPGWNIPLGLVLVVLGQFVRSLGMITAASNFHHYVQEYKALGHKLITHGIYGFMRHPSYFGFFHWTLGLHILLFNPICILTHSAILYYFFNDRIAHEERFLVRFFGGDYVAYRKKVWSGMYGVA
jgi:protein-S-isoprenylcysteine O-methyltransferase